MSWRNYVIVSSTVLKDDYVRKYEKLGDIYSQSLAFLLERAVFYVDDKNPGVGAHIEAMLERRGKEEDKTLSQGYNTQKLTFVPKTANIIGLQIADLVANPIACHILRLEAPNPAFDIIKKNIYLSNGKVFGAGRFLW